MKTERRKAFRGDSICMRFDDKRLAGKDKTVTAIGLGGVFVGDIFVRHTDYVVIIDDLDSIKEELERARIEMHELAADFGLIHEKVIAASQRLDGLLNRYDAMRKGEK